MEQKDEDIELVKSYLAGDTDVFKRIVSRHLKEIYNFVYRLSGRSEEAQDITQEVFIKIWKNLAKFDPTQNFKTWIFAIARNTTIDWLRKRKPLLFSDFDRDEHDSFESNLPDTTIPPPDELFERNESKQRLEQILQNISIDYRTIILLHHIDELTFEEIGTILQKPMNTVKSQYRRALLALKKILKNAPR